MGAHRIQAAPRHWAQIGEETFVAGIWLLYAVFRVAGRLPFRLVLYPVVLWYWLFRPSARRASLEYLGHLQEATGALGRAPGRRESIRHFLSFADTILDKVLTAVPVPEVSLSRPSVA